MKFALFTAKERFREDWAKAVVYLADAIADAYPRKNAFNHKKRPQDGPSGYRKVSKASQGYDEPVIFNGVDCSTDLWNFSDDDWRKMGKEGNNWVQSQRDRIKARQANGGRGGGGRGRGRGRDRGRGRGGGGRGSPNNRGVNATSSD